MSRREMSFGRMGKGKSTRAYYEASRGRSGVVVFDPNSQFENGPLVFSKDQLSSQLDKGVTPIIYRPVLDVEKHFESFADVVLDLRDVSIVIDESSRLQSPHWCHPWLDELVRRSRALSLDLYLTQHRMADANGLILELATDYVFFGTKHPGSLERIEEYTDSEVRERVRALEGFEWLAWSVEHETFVVNADPESWFVPIGRPAAHEEETCPVK